MEPLEVEVIEFYAKDNSVDHHTNCYDLIADHEDGVPVFRRGFNFYFAVQFNRYFDESRDVVWVSFGFGPKPHVTKGTKVILPLTVRERQTPRDIYHWFMSLHRHDGNVVTMQVHIPPNAQVGIWHCSLQTCISGRLDRREEFKCEDDIYVLFNPWCRDDGVYIDRDDERDEYVMNECGKIWCGTYKHPRGVRWIFGQFHEVILPACIFLLDKSGLPYSDWNSPVLVTRAISQVVNAVDGEGLLEGRWDGDYIDGTSPHSWTGSIAIFDQYLRSAGTPVKYGQCWVFSAVTVTACRALGIPCRSTTNYISAHDVNCSLSIDKYFDMFGNKIDNGDEDEDGYPDMCWNFHVWNDVWMARPDLPSGYGGWQVIDATPQEENNVVYRCGPASVEAVRRAEVGYLYDTPYVFAEINADICHFQEDQESEWGFNRLTINDYRVGKKIVTKKVGADDDKGETDLLDITREFKNPESTVAERLAVYNAIRGVPRAAHQTYEIADDEEDDDVEFDLMETETVLLGQDFDVVVNIYNHSNEVRTIDGTLSASTTYYTGVTADHIKRTTGTFSVRPREKEVLKIHVTDAEYLSKLLDHDMIKIYATATVRETAQTWSEEDDIVLKKPALDIETNEQRFAIGQEGQADFSFRNPLNRHLTACTYSVEGPGLQKPKVPYYRDVQPNEIVEFSEKFFPHRVGERKIVANFNCNEMEGVNGSATIFVQ